MLGRAPGMDLGPLGGHTKTAFGSTKGRMFCLLELQGHGTRNKPPGEVGSASRMTLFQCSRENVACAAQGLAGWVGGVVGGGTLGHRAQPFHSDQAGRSKASQHPICAPHLASVSTVTPHDGMVLINFTSADSEAKQGQET